MEAKANTHKRRDLKEAVADVLAEADFKSRSLLVGNAKYATSEWASVLKGRDKDVFQLIFRWSDAQFDRSESVVRLAATLLVLRRDVEPSASLKKVRAVALYASFEGVSKALCSEEVGEQRAHFSWRAKKDLGFVLGKTQQAYRESDAAIWRRHRDELHRTREAQETMDLDFSVYPGDVKCVAFLLHSIRWHAAEAETQEREFSRGCSEEMEDCSDASIRVEQVLRQHR